MGLRLAGGGNLCFGVKSSVMESCGITGSSYGLCDSQKLTGKIGLQLRRVIIRGSWGGGGGVMVGYGHL